MRTFIYVRAEVCPDITGSINFDHAFVFASSKSQAYEAGAEKLPAPRQGSVCNDYVIDVSAQS